MGRASDKKLHVRDRVLGLYFVYLLLLWDPKTQAGHARLVLMNLLGAATINVAAKHVPTYYLLVLCRCVRGPPDNDVR